MAPMEHPEKAPRGAFRLQPHPRRGRPVPVPQPGLPRLTSPGGSAEGGTEGPQEERPGDPDHAEDDCRHAQDDTADLGERRGDGTRRVTAIEEPHRRRTQDLLDLERDPGRNTEREGVSRRWIQAPRGDARLPTLPGDVRPSGHEPGGTRAGSGGNGRLPVRPLAAGTSSRDGALAEVSLVAWAGSPR